LNPCFYPIPSLLRALHVPDLGRARSPSFGQLQPFHCIFKSALCASFELPEAVEAFDVLDVLADSLYRAELLVLEHAPDCFPSLFRDALDGMNPLLDLCPIVVAVLPIPRRSCCSSR